MSTDTPQEITEFEKSIEEYQRTLVQKTVLVMLVMGEKIEDKWSKYKGNKSYSDFYNDEVQGYVFGTKKLPAKG